MKVPELDEETLKKLPQWYSPLRDIYAGVESEQNKSRPSSVVRDQPK
jgi:hypothetical protein